MTTIDDLIAIMMDAPDKFNHLKIFLHRETTEIQSDLGGKFLFVSPDSFGLVKINDLTVENNYIKLFLEDAITGKSASFKIDTNDKSFQFLLIDWKDILELANANNT